MQVNIKIILSWIRIWTFAFWFIIVSFVTGRGCHTVLPDQHSDRQSHWGIYRGRSSDATFRIVCRSWRPFHVLYYVSWDSGFLISSKHPDEAFVVLQDEANNHSDVSPVSSDRTLQSSGHRGLQWRPRAWSDSFHYTLWYLLRPTSCRSCLWTSFDTHAC